MLALLLLACGDAKIPLGGADASDDSGGGDDSAAAVRPVVLEVRSAACVTNGDSVDIWTVDIAVADPQDDIDRSASTLTVREDDADVVSYGLACTSDTCSGSWRSTDDGVGCAFAGEFRILLVDEQGNSSEPFDHPV